MWKNEEKEERKGWMDKASNQGKKVRMRGKRKTGGKKKSGRSH